MGTLHKVEVADLPYHKPRFVVLYLLQKSLDQNPDHYARTSAQRKIIRTIDCLYHF